MVNAIVLAGGKSRRFGTDKAFAKVGGALMIESLLSVLNLVFKRIIVVTNYPLKYQGFPVEIVEDNVKGIGPLAGIQAGLQASDSERNFVVACDMPLIKASLIHYISNLAEGQVVVPRIGERLEPLHGVYSKSCLPAIERQIKAGHYKIQDFYNQVDVCYVEEVEIKRFDPELMSFLNINLQKDLARIETCLKQ